MNSFNIFKSDIYNELTDNMSKYVNNIDKLKNNDNKSREKFKNGQGDHLLAIKIKGSIITILNSDEFAIASDDHKSNIIKHIKTTTSVLIEKVNEQKKNIQIRN